MAKNQTAAPKKKRAPRKSKDEATLAADLAARADGTEGQAGASEDGAELLGDTTPQTVRRTPLQRHAEEVAKLKADAPDLLKKRHRCEMTTLGSNGEFQCKVEGTAADTHKNRRGTRVLLMCPGRDIRKLFPSLSHMNAICWEHADQLNDAIITVLGRSLVDAIATEAVIEDELSEEILGVIAEIRQFIAAGTLGEGNYPPDRSKEGDAVDLLVKKIYRRMFFRLSEEMLIVLRSRQRRAEQQASQQSHVTSVLGEVDQNVFSLALKRRVTR